MTTKAKKTTKPAQNKRAPRRAKAETVLVLRTCKADMTAHGGFVWPNKGPVSCPDWDPAPRCGNGLHGLLWGDGDAALLDWSSDAKSLVVEVEAGALVELNGKVKFPRGRVVYVGDMRGAADLIMSRAPAGTKCVGGTATAGDCGTATAGYRGTATAGDHGTATAGYRGTATAGDCGTATAGVGGTATAGDYGTATAGVGGTATAGDYGTATAGVGGTATAGVGGAISISWYDEQGRRYQRLVAEIDGVKMRAGVRYRVENGAFVEADK